MNLGNLSLLLLRLSISYIWLSAGLSKLFNKNFINTFPQTIETFASSTNFSFYSTFLKDHVMPNSYTFAQLTTWGEVLTGVAFLLGFPMLIAVICGIFMNINYFLVATSTPSQFINILLIFSQFAIYSTGAGSIWGLSPKICKK